MMRVAALLLLVSCCGALAAEVELGRLIYSPEERNRLETQRHAAERTDPAESAGIVTGSVRLGGMVTRTDGSTFLWLDGKRVRPKRPADVRAAESRLRTRVGREVALRSEAPASPQSAGSSLKGGSAR